MPRSTRLGRNRARATLASVVAVGVALCARSTAAAKPRAKHVDPTHQYAVVIPPTLTAAPLPSPIEDGEQAPDMAKPARVVARWRGPNGTTVSIARVNGPSRRARAHDSSFLDDFETGVRRHARQFKRRSRRVDKIDGVPVLELSFVYDTADGERLAVTTKTLFFRLYALTLSVSTPARRERKIRRVARRLVRSFVPEIGSSGQ